MAEAKGKGAARKTTKRARSASSRTKNAAASRKAPTQTASGARGVSSNLKVLLAVLVAAVVVSGVSVWIGMSDNGRIDVASTISQRASTQEAEGDVEGSERTRSVSSPQAERTQENSGLIGRGNRETEQQRQAAAQQPPVDTNATSSATSTDESATSTEETNTTENDEDSDESESVESTADENAATSSEATTSTE